MDTVGGLSVSLNGANWGEGDRTRSVPGRDRAAVQEENEGEEEDEGGGSGSFSSFSTPPSLTSGPGILLRRGELAGVEPVDETWAAAWRWVSELELDRGWSAAGSVWAPVRNSWEEDVVSGPKWDLGGGRRLLVCGGSAGSSGPMLGLRLQGPEERGVSEGLAVSNLVLWSGRPGTRPSFLGTDETSCGMGSGSCRSLLSVLALEVKIKEMSSGPGVYYF